MTDTERLEMLKAATTDAIHAVSDAIARVTLIGGYADRNARNHANELLVETNKNLRNALLEIMRD